MFLTIIDTGVINCVSQMAEDDPWCKEKKYKTDEQMIYCMQMALDFSSDIPMFLFKDWNTTGGGRYFLTILFCMILAISIELISFIRWYLKDSSRSAASQSSLHINKSEMG